MQRSPYCGERTDACWPSDRRKGSKPLPLPSEAASVPRMDGSNDHLTRFKVGLVQMAMSDDVGRNLRAASAGVTEAAKGGAAIVCLPELFRSRYFAQREDPALFDLAEPVAGPSTEALGKVAREAGVVVIAPIFERRAAGLYHNTAVVLDADG